MNKIAFSYSRKLNSKFLSTIVFTGFCLVSLLLTSGCNLISPTQVDASQSSTLNTSFNNSPDVSLRIEQDEDTPLRILSANVKVAPAQEFEKITGNRAASPFVMTVPNVELVNTSEKVITEFSLIIEDKNAQRTKGLRIHGQNIKPNERFYILRENFVGGIDPATLRKVIDPVKSQRFWLPFPNREHLVIRVTATFQDGSKWFNRSQRGGI